MGTECEWRTLAAAAAAWVGHRLPSSQEVPGTAPRTDGGQRPQLLCSGSRRTGLACSPVPCGSDENGVLLQLTTLPRGHLGFGHVSAVLQAWARVCALPGKGLPGPFQLGLSPGCCGHPCSTCTLGHACGPFSSRWRSQRGQGGATLPLSRWEEHEAVCWRCGFVPWRL